MTARTIRVWVNETGATVPDGVPLTADTIRDIAGVPGRVWWLPYPIGDLHPSAVRIDHGVFIPGQDARFIVTVKETP